MPQRRSVSRSLIQSLFAAAKHQQLDLVRILENAGVDHEALFLDGADPRETNDQRVELTHLGPILRSLWHEMEDEASGFLSKPFKLGVFSMMCHAIISAGNLRRGLLRSAKFIQLLGDDLQLELKETGDEARLEIHYRNPHNVDEVFFVTSLFVIWIRLSCWLIQRPMLLERIEFKFPKPSYSEEFSLMFPCRHVFSSNKNVVVFNRRLLSLPILQDSDDLVPFLHSAPESLLTQFRADDSLTAQIKRLLLQRKGMETELDNLSFDVVADELHMTTHTIRRHLKEEGNSFQEIKDSIRRDKAIYLLGKPQLTIQDISAKLGFSEAAAFNRAFKKWTGSTPGAYRSNT